MDEIISGSGSGSGNGSIIPFTCTDPSTFSPDGISNISTWTIRHDKPIAIPSAVVLGIICIVAFVWNLFILITYCYKWHLLKHPANIFLFALALFDFIVSIAVLPASVATYAIQTFAIGSTDSVRCGFCYTQGFLMVFCPVMSVNILAVLSIDRCLLLSKPLVYKKKESPLLAVVCLGVITFITFLLCVLPAFGFGEWEFNKNMAICMARFTPTKNLYFMFVIVIYCLIPTVILGTTNIWTYKIVSKFLRKRLERRRSYRGSYRERKEDNSRHVQQQRQLIKVFGALFVANIVIWLPVMLMAGVVFVVDNTDIPDWLFVMFWVFVASNTVVHPIMESSFNKELRLAVKKSQASFKKKVHHTSRNLARLATNNSIRNISVVEMPSTPKGERSSVFASNQTEAEVVSAMNTPDVVRKHATTLSVTPMCSKPSTPQLPSKMLSSSTPNNSEPSTPQLPGEVNVTPTHSNPSTPQLPSKILNSTSSNSKPSTPKLAGKKREVSLSLPNEAQIYYPSKERNNTNLTQQETVMEDMTDYVNDDNVFVNTDNNPDDHIDSNGYSSASLHNGGLTIENSTSDKFPESLV